LSGPPLVPTKVVMPGVDALAKTYARVFSNSMCGPTQASFQVAADVQGAERFQARAVILGQRNFGSDTLSLWTKKAKAPYMIYLLTQLTRIGYAQAEYFCPYDHDKKELLWHMCWTGRLTMFSLPALMEQGAGKVFQGAIKAACSYLKGICGF